MGIWFRISEINTIDTTVCAIYTRQSSNTSADFTSCQMQFEACEAFIKAHAGNGWRWIEEQFDDQGWSGATLDRPALQRLLAKIRNGEIDRLIVYRLDRLSRSVIDSVQLLNELREQRIELVIVTSPEIGSTARDSLLLNILSAFAEFERELIAKRIADARAALKRKGRRVGGAPPLGYDAEPKKPPGLIGRVPFYFKKLYSQYLPSNPLPVHTPANILKAMFLRYFSIIHLQYWSFQSA